MATCDRCWDGRHCMGFAGCTCTGCADLKANRFGMQDRLGLEEGKKFAKTKEKKPKKASGPRKKRPYVYKYRPSPVPVQQPTIEMLPFMEQVIAEQLREGMSVMYVVNHTNFTEGQVLAVKAKMDDALLS